MDSEQADEAALARYRDLGVQGRALEIIACRLRGKTVQEIADEAGLSRATVYRQIKAVRKLITERAETLAAFTAPAHDAERCEMAQLAANRVEVAADTGYQWRNRTIGAPTTVCRGTEARTIAPALNCVYFMQDTSGRNKGLVKIGTTYNVGERHKQIERDVGGTVRILGVIGGAGVPTEQDLHKRFEAHCAHGEWFEPHPDILEYAGQMQAHE